MYSIYRFGIERLAEELKKEQSTRRRESTNLSEDLLKLNIMEIEKPIDILLFVINSKDTWDIYYYVVVKLFDYPKTVDDLFNILLERTPGHENLFKRKEINDFYCILLKYYFNTLEIQEEIEKRNLTSHELAIIFTYLPIRDIHNKNSSLIESYIKAEEKFFWTNFDKVQFVRLSQLDYVIEKLFKYNQHDKVIKMIDIYLQKNDYINVDIIRKYILAVKIVLDKNTMDLEELIKPIHYSKWFFEETELNFKEFAQFEEAIFKSLPKHVNWFDFEYLLKYYLENNNLLSLLIEKTLENNIDYVSLFNFFTSGAFDLKDFEPDCFINKIETILNDGKFSAKISETKEMLGHFFYLILHKNFKGNEEYFKFVNNDEYFSKGYVDCLYKSLAFSIKQFNSRNDYIPIYEFDNIDKKLDNFLTLLNLAGLYNIERHIEDNRPILEKEKKLYKELYESWEEELNVNDDEEEFDDNFSSIFYN